MNMRTQLWGWGVESRRMFEVALKKVVFPLIALITVSVLILWSQFLIRRQAIQAVNHVIAKSH
jgi:hypothetical protein